MKNLLLQLGLLLLITGCKTTNPAASLTTNLDRSSQSALKGNWKIANVSYPGSDYIKVTSFQIADAKCFIGSIWSFIPNNNKGSMNLSQNNCPSFSSPIVWSINKDGDFVFKIVDPGLKSKQVTQGYVLKIAGQTESSFKLIDVINVGGQDKEVWEKKSGYISLQGKISRSKWTHFSMITAIFWLKGMISGKM